MNERAGETATNRALAMLSAFASVGAAVFDLSITDIEGDEVEGMQRPNRSLQDIRRMIGKTLQEARCDRHNVIVRPRSTTTLLIQLDDLDSTKAERIAAHAFIVIRTSPGQDGTGNFQAWLAVKDAPAEKEAAKDFSRRLRKGVGADLTASGATRISGSLNFKAKYAPVFPLVELSQVNLGHVTSCDEMEQRGFVARRVEEPWLPRTRPNDGRMRWPSYQRCIQGAPKAHGGDRPDVSRADFTWARTAYHWGRSVDDIAARLMELSSKARTEGERYALLTAQNAALSVDKESQPLKSTPAPRR